MWGKTGPVVPAKARGEPRERVVHARFSASELAAITSAATAADMTVSGFLRCLTLEGAGVRPFFSEDDRAVLEVLIFDIRAIGINLNQVGRELNRGGRPPDHEILETMLVSQQLIAAALIELRRHASQGAQRHRRVD
ncbi:plasmid mobilization relaxosome protein MobC [Rhizobium sp. XQZ8]|nr:plasmid mobilization relaxosome protein MobC [Rhizobium populisoli]